jgi:quinol monooxygenase YgiN
MLGNDANWVRNVRAARGLAALRRGIREQVQLEEVGPGDRAPILRRYLAVAPGARPHLPVDRHAPLEEFERIADQFPVFRINPAAPGAERGDGQATRPGVRGALELSAHMTVRPGQLDGFKKQAAECIRLTRQKDTGTLRYDWFLSSDGAQCEVREAYTGAQGLIEHRANVAPALQTLFEHYADNHTMTIYGQASRQLLDLAEAHHMTGHITWFSFLEGLEPAARP